MKKGFTLAESLVAMAIVGVAMALVLPVIHRSHPNQELVMFQKAYYLASRAVNELINDDALYPDNDDPTESGFSNCEQVSYLGDSYGSEIDDDGDYVNVDLALDKFCGLMAAKMNSACVNNTFTTSDGMRWFIPETTFQHGEPGETSIIINVNVNGHEESQCDDIAIGEINAPACAPEFFSIRVTRDGRVSPAGAYARMYLNEKNKSRQYGEFNLNEA